MGQNQNLIGADSTQGNVSGIGAILLYVAGQIPRCKQVSADITTRARANIVTKFKAECCCP